jgi:hypothetical protein
MSTRFKVLVGALIVIGAFVMAVGVIAVFSTSRAENNFVVVGSAVISLLLYAAVWLLAERFLTALTTVGSVC